MLPSARRGRRAVAGAIGAGALASAMFFRCRREAPAQPPPPVPPPCTTAKLARVMSGVSFDTSNYLSTHPDVNGYFTSLKRPTQGSDPGSGTELSRRQSPSSGQAKAIRQPSVDFRNRCP